MTMRKRKTAPVFTTGAVLCLDVLGKTKRDGSPNRLVSLSSLYGISLPPSV